MRIKFFSVLLGVVLMSVMPTYAANWIMDLATDGTWTYENEIVSVTYSFDRNIIATGAYLQPTACAPAIQAKIKNNTDDFIYLDLAKTYITRNGEAELYQNFVTMSKDKSDDSDNSKLSQTVMPVPPHASKTLSFPLFLKEADCYDGLVNWVDVTKYVKYYKYCPKENANLNEIFEYNLDNSPIRADVSFSYSTTEKGEKQTKIHKEFYVNFIAAVNNTKTKDFETVMPDSDERNWFTMQSDLMSFPKAKKVKADKKDKKDNKKDKTEKKENKKYKEEKKSVIGLMGGRRG